MAEFEFHNHGLATRVRMGFPESGRDPEQTFWRFTSTVDGVPVACERKLIALDHNLPSYNAHWHKEVGFAEGGRRFVRVKYRSPVGTSTSGDFVSYDFSGSNWWGSIESCQITITVHFPFTANPKYRSDLVQRGNSFSGAWGNRQDGQAVVFYYRRGTPASATRMTQKEAMLIGYEALRSNRPACDSLGTGIFTDLLERSSRAEAAEL